MLTVTCILNCLMSKANENCCGAQHDNTSQANIKMCQLVYDSRCNRECPLNNPKTTIISIHGLDISFI